MSSENGRILIVDDDEQACAVTAQMLEQQGLTPLLAFDGKAALQKVRRQSPDALLVNFKMPGVDGMEWLRPVKALDQDIPVVMITGYADVCGAVQAMPAGTYEYLPHPFQPEDLIHITPHVLAERRLKVQLRHSHRKVAVNPELREIMGPSDNIGRLIAEVNLVAKSNFNVIIIGETGSGKEVVARAIHHASPRGDDVFVPVDCGAIPETLLEGELFGYEKGAFTGAVGSKHGKFELAQGGTLFLDEILNLPLGSQAKLLRALQEKTICRLGGTRPMHIDVRLVVAANRNLEAAAGAGVFRVDLFFRLNEFLLRVPPLRERPEDIIYLAKRFLDLTNAELNKAVKGFSESAVNALVTAGWPGNVRQLRSTIRRAVLLVDDMVTDRHLDIAPAGRSSPVPLDSGSKTPAVNGGALPLREIVARSTEIVEHEAVEQALRRARGNKAEAARALQIDYKTIQSKLRKYGIQLNDKNNHESQAQPKPK